MAEVDIFKFTDSMDVVVTGQLGRKRRIKSPEHLLQIWEEYDKVECADEIEEIPTKSGVFNKIIRVPRTWAGFKAFTKLPPKTFNDYEHREEFKDIMGLIRLQCESDIIKGGLMNKYNSKIAENELKHNHNRKEKVEVIHEAGFTWDKVLNQPAQKKIDI